MEREDWLELCNTLERVEQSVNQRFEKNAELYISIENVEILKRKLHTGAFKDIEGMYIAKKYSAEVLTTVILNNAWLVQNNQIGCLKSIFNVCDLSYLSNVMEMKVFKYVVDIPKHIRKSLIELFLKRVDSDKCEAMLELYEQNNSNYNFLADPLFKAICVKKILSLKESMDKYRTFKEMGEYYRDILEERKTLNGLFTEEDCTDEVRRSIFSEQFFTDNSLTYSYWVECVVPLYGESDLFKRMAKEISRYNSYDANKIKKLIKNLFPLIKEDNYAQFIDKLVDGCDRQNNSNVVTQIIEYVSKWMIGKPRNYLNDLEKALDDRGIHVFVEKERQPIDIDNIIDILCCDNISDGKMRYITTMFNSQYKKNCEEQLQYISERVYEQDIGGNSYFDNFVSFCCMLMQHYAKRDRYRYLLFIIKELEVNDSTTGIILKYIEAENLLRKNKLNSEVKNVIADFVKENDFNLFKKLTV